MYPYSSFVTVSNKNCSETKYSTHSMYFVNSFIFLNLNVCYGSFHVQSVLTDTLLFTKASSTTRCSHLRKQDTPFSHSTCSYMSTCRQVDNLSLLFSTCSTASILQLSRINSQSDSQHAQLQSTVPQVTEATELVYG